MLRKKILIEPAKLRNADGDYCLLLCRVSTEKQKREGNGLENQQKWGMDLAKRKNWKIAAIFLEDLSGRTINRPVFDEICKFLQMCNCRIKYCVVITIDRVTREGSVEYINMKRKLQQYGASLVDFEGTIQPPVNMLEHLGFEYDWSVYSPSETAEKLRADQSSEEIKKMLNRNIGSEIEQTNEGYYMRCAPDGYLNKKIIIDGKKKSILEHDPERVHFYKEMFRLASLHYPHSEIVDRINAMGFLSKQRNLWEKDDEKGDRIIGKVGGVPLRIDRLQAILNTSIYYGIVMEKWTHYKAVKAAFPGIGDIELFNKIHRGKKFIKELPDGKLQLIEGSEIDNAPKRYSRHNPDFPFKNLILCPECDKPFKGSFSKGQLGKRYPFYHCSRGHKHLGVARAKFENNVIRYLEPIRYKKGFTELLEAFLSKQYSKRKDEVIDFQQKVKTNLEGLRSEKRRLVDAFIGTSNTIVKRELESRLEETENKISEAENQVDKSSFTTNDLDCFLHYAKNTVEHIEERLMDTANPQYQEGLFRLVFDGLPSYRKVQSGTYDFSLFFAMLMMFHKANSRVVRHEHLKWNQLEQAIVNFNQTVEYYDLMIFPSPSNCRNISQNGLITVL